MQSLDVVARLFPLILSGQKTSTIRWRERTVTPGPMMFLCEGDAGRSVVVDVHNCTHMPLSQAAAFLGRADEWPPDVMLEGMREHYPQIQLTSIVQVIEFVFREAG
ncbi:ASCH domain-containing protein [Afifella sp. IM 167]|uniref:ASCH domain-containing protein n=1 Tax=Afifella sp. IM 167 TaxID=2033586 RepID=UPI001CCE1884|nr:ASCH domain-containing protein [Afifella sp. IM 167]MBZ8133616.1 hypothetical protein [Afifella sp. IM 167]